MSFIFCIIDIYCNYYIIIFHVFNIAKKLEIKFFAFILCSTPPENIIIIYSLFTFSCTFYKLTHISTSIATAAITQKTTESFRFGKFLTPLTRNNSESKGRSTVVSVLSGSILLMLRFTNTMIAIDNTLCTQSSILSFMESKPHAPFKFSENVLF